MLAAYIQIRDMVSETLLRHLNVAQFNTKGSKTGYAGLVNEGKQLLLEYIGTAHFTRMFLRVLMVGVRGKVALWNPFI
jgi:hypothetical protein